MKNSFGKTAIADYALRRIGLSWAAVTQIPLYARLFFSTGVPSPRP